MKYLGAVFNQPEHPVIADPAKPGGPGMPPGILIINPIHIRKNLAQICLQKGRQRYRPLRIWSSHCRMRIFTFRVKVSVERKMEYVQLRN